MNNNLSIKYLTIGICFQALIWGGVTGKISGSIVNRETGESLPGANVVVVGTSQGAMADDDGEYYILNLRPGIYSISASMIGFQATTRKDVTIHADHTALISFELSTKVIEGEEIFVIADKEIILMDRSASEVSIVADDIKKVPKIRDIKDYLNLEAGIENDLIRGGSLDQTALMVDGMSFVDNRSNQPVMMVNMSSIDQISIIKGGFNAEYGNIRSGLINIITKEGSPTSYSGSIDIHYDPPQYKHDGFSLYDPMNYYLRPFLEPSVMWGGTQHWDTDMQESYPEFIGWNAVSANLLSDNNPSNDMSPSQARDLFLWYHRAEGSDDLDQKQGQYAHKPDINLDIGFGGPVPLVGKAIGNMSFYFSHHNKNEMFALPTARDYYSESNTQLKLTMTPKEKIKLKIEGLYGEVNTLSASPEGSGNNWYLDSGTDILSSYLATSDAYADGGSSAMYWPNALNPFNIYRSMVGLTLDHVISPSTFYNIRISNVHLKNACYGPDFIRDTTAIRSFGNVIVDEAPLGFLVASDYTPSGDGMVFASLGGVTRDNSEVTTLNIKVDLTSQINKRHQFKTGFEFNYDDLNTNYQSQFSYAPKNNYVNQYRAYPSRLSAYIQDKIEIKGLFANLGLRIDSNNPNKEWYTVDVYSKYLSPTFKEDFTQSAPKESAKGHIKISPRIGISHPVTSAAKLYFNYGHFYSMPSSIDMYQIGYGTAYQGIDFLGNPSAEIPKTVSYELGVEYNLSNTVLLHASGYYKDVFEQIAYVNYTNIDGSVNYTTTENSNYEDIRGFEIRAQKRYGRWFTGWINYNYIVQTWGYFGRDHYYENPRDQLRYGYQNPKQEKPLARPFARSSLVFHTPKAWGPKIFGMRPFGQWQANMLLTWKAGDYTTWDPLETYVLQDNLQWRSEFNGDLRIAKNISGEKNDLLFFMDITNVLGLQYISIQGFDGGDDWRDYLESLHLPMYDGEEYLAKGYTGGNDRLGDVSSKTKPHINMPNRGFLTYLNPRRFTIGFRYNF
ncbi:MAG: TonB-dependent receptor [Candidatus Marinimicrobia bacterium]|nr:TonB-dependent receptor [Candidatus Neomarinimicrobiota bacterium]MBT7119651.1 TonB-dependent receptor [Candidatus Neomarinimicrobiota bacterium]